MNFFNTLLGQKLSNDISGVGNVKEEQEKNIDITNNGTTEILPDDGKVLSKVTVNVNVATSGGETVQSNHSVTSYEVWGETLNIAYNDSFEMNVAECTKDITNIKTGVYKMFINDVGYDALVLVMDEGISIRINETSQHMIATIEGVTYFASTVDEGVYTIRLVSQTNDIEDCVVYSQNRKTDPSTYVYVTNGFSANNAQINISVNGEIFADNEPYLDTDMSIDGYVVYQSASLPPLGEYIEQGKPIVITITQTNNDGVVVTKTISGSPQLVGNYFAWGNSDLFILPG